MQLDGAGGLICSGSGTFGVLVGEKAGAQRVYLLSCSHVIANSGQFPGDFATVPDYRKVVQQPVSSPCDSTMNRIGLLQACYSVIVPASAGNTTSDVALALVDAAVATATSRIHPATGNSIMQFASEDPSTWGSNMQTRLLGAMGTYGWGNIVQYYGDTPVPMTYPGVGDVLFTGLVQYATQCEEGDSGGPVIDLQNRLLEIHVGGSAGSGMGLFFPLGSYLLQKGLVLV